jgi:hypothetical protein
VSTEAIVLTGALGKGEGGAAGGLGCGVSVLDGVGLRLCEGATGGGDGVLDGDGAGRVDGVGEG